MKYMKVLLIVVSTVFMFACTKLNESQRGTLEAASSSVSAAGLLQSAYESMNGPFQDQARYWSAQQHTTDETIGPTRGPDWDDNGVWRVLHAHTWNADHGFLRDTYRELLQIQFSATSVLDRNPSAQQAAEARFIRAFSMFSVLDGWDQVPYRADLKNLTILPETKQGAAAADFIISELNAIINDLPASPTTKANKDAARVLLMKCYLNKGVFANRAAPTFAAADMNQVITLADQIINSAKYSLTTNFFDNFAPDNSTDPNKSKELIYTLENIDGTRGGNVRSMWFEALHYNQKPSGWNGFTTLSDFYNKFGATDQRRGGTYPGVTNVSGLRVGFLVGQQFNEAGVALNDRRGNALSFTPTVRLKETGNDLEITGIRVIKYPPDYAGGDQSDNEYVIYRYADVLLMKAEAILRGGTATGTAPYNSALNIVNFIRLARGAVATAAVDLNFLLDERGRELYYEQMRRQDLIRFGKFLQPWQEKAASGPERLVFPIPSDQLAANPNLKQNTGY